MLPLLLNLCQHIGYDGIIVAYQVVRRFNIVPCGFEPILGHATFSHRHFPGNEIARRRRNRLCTAITEQKSKQTILRLRTGPATSESS